MRITSRQLRQLIREELLREATATASPGTFMDTYDGHKFLYNPKAVIDIEPAVLDFGEVNVGESKTLPVTLKNPWVYHVFVTGASSDNDEFTISIPEDVRQLSRQQVTRDAGERIKRGQSPDKRARDASESFLAATFGVTLAGSDESFSKRVRHLHRWWSPGFPSEVKMAITFEPTTHGPTSGRIAFTAGHERRGSMYENLVEVRGRGVPAESDVYGRYMMGSPRGRPKVPLLSLTDYKALQKTDPDLAALVADYDNLTPEKQRAVEAELRRALALDLEDSP